MEKVTYYIDEVTGERKVKLPKFQKGDVFKERIPKHRKETMSELPIDTTILAVSPGTDRFDDYIYFVKTRYADHDVYDALIEFYIEGNFELIYDI